MQTHSFIYITLVSVTLVASVPFFLEGEWQNETISAGIRPAGGATQNIDRVILRANSPHCTLSQKGFYHIPLKCCSFFFNPNYVFYYALVATQSNL